MITIKHLSFLCLWYSTTIPKIYLKVIILYQIKDNIEIASLEYEIYYTLSRIFVFVDWIVIDIKINVDLQTFCTLTSFDVFKVFSREFELIQRNIT